MRVGKLGRLHAAVWLRQHRGRQVAEAHWDHWTAENPRRSRLVVYPWTAQGSRAQHEDERFAALQRGADLFEPIVAGENLGAIGRHEYVALQTKFLLDQVLNGFCDTLVLGDEADKHSCHRRESTMA